MNKTFSFLMSLLIFYGIGGGALFTLVTQVSNMWWGALAFIAYAAVSLLFLLDLGRP